MKTFLAHVVRFGISLQLIAGFAIAAQPVSVDDLCKMLFQGSKRGVALTHLSPRPMGIQNLNRKIGYFRIGEAEFKGLVETLQGASNVLDLMRMIDSRFNLGELARTGSDEVDRILPFRIGRRQTPAQLILQSLIPFKGLDPSDRPHVFFLSDPGAEFYESRVLGLHFGETGLPNGIPLPGNEAIDLNPKTGAALNPKDIKLKVRVRDGAKFISVDPSIAFGGGLRGKQVYLHHPLEIRYLIENHVATWEGFKKVIGAFYGPPEAASLDYLLGIGLGKLNSKGSTEGPFRFRALNSFIKDEISVRAIAKKSAITIAEAPEMGEYRNEIYLHFFKAGSGSQFGTFAAVEWAVTSANSELMSPDAYRNAGFHELGISPTEPNSYLGHSATRFIGVYRVE